MRMNKSIQSNVTWRAILIGLSLIPVNAYWVIQIEGVWDSGHITNMSLFLNATISLLMVVLINIALRKISPRVTLSQAELLTIFIMLNLATCIASEDFAQVLFATIPHVFWFATPENEWARFFPYVPDWLSVRNRSVLDGFYNAHSTLYTTRTLRPWLKPFIWWSAFTVVMIFIMLCINVLMKKQWIEREKLTYPVIQLPLTITEGGGSVKLFLSKPLWIGFAIAAAVDIINGLNYVFPRVPYLPIKLNHIHPFFTTQPWNAIGWMYFSIFPFMVGLGFFLPLDLSFSIWFFYLFSKAQLILSAVFGLQSIPNFPYPNDQSAGALLAFAFVLIWLARKHLYQVVMKVFRTLRAGPESQETQSYRWALFGLLLGSAFILIFSYKAGMTLGVIVLLYVVYFAMATAITRMRAELGPPLHELSRVTPHTVLYNFMGSRRLGPSNVISFASFFWFDLHHVRHPMPHQLEGFKMAQQTRMATNRIALAMMLAVVVGTIASFAIMLDGSYKYLNFPKVNFGRRAYDLLANRMHYPTGPDYPALGAMGVGFLFTMFLMVMGRWFVWWPFHPAGYALSMHIAGIDYVWSCLLISFLAKWTLLRYGGLKLYRKAIPFFVGLVLGEFVVVSVLNAIGIIFKTPTYTFWIFG